MRRAEHQDARSKYKKDGWCDDVVFRKFIPKFPPISFQNFFENQEHQKAVKVKIHSKYTKNKCKRHLNTPKDTQKALLQSFTFLVWFLPDTRLRFPDFDFGFEFEFDHKRRGKREVAEDSTIL